MKEVIRILAVIVAAALFAIAGYYIYDQFRERSVSEKLSEIVHDEDRRVLSDELITYLSDTTLEVRARAALAVGRIDSKESDELLLGMLDDEAIDVAAAAAFALGLTGESEHAATLLDMAFDLPSAVGARAVASAGRLADSSMADIIEQLTAYLDHPSPDVRRAACMAFFYTRARSKADSLIAVVDRESDDEVRATGLWVLARLKVTGAYDLFVEHLADQNPFVRSVCVQGLGCSNLPKARHYLRIALNDSDPNVVACAISELGNKKDPKAATKLAGKFKKQNNEKLDVKILHTLQKLKYDGVTDAALETINADTSVNVIAAAIRYLAVIRGDRIVNLLDSLSGADDPYLRAVCAEAYGLIGKKNVDIRLSYMFNDEDPMVRTAALEALAELDHNELDFYLRKAMADPDRVVVATALEQIRAKKLRAYLLAMSTMMSRGANIDMDLRRSLVQTAGAFLKDNKEDTGATLILIDGILDSEYIVRLEAAGIYRNVLNEDKFSAVPPASTEISRGELQQAFEEIVTNPYAIVMTNKGKIEIELYFDAAPLTVLNFMELAKRGFYEGLSFHRVIPNFVVQGGDPRGDGWGGPSYCIRSEYSPEPYRRGTVGVATSGKDTGGSQFFITLSPQPHLEARYTVFGQVTLGMEVVQNIVRGDRIQKITIERVQR